MDRRGPAAERQREKVRLLANGTQTLDFCGITGRTGVGIESTALADIGYDARLESVILRGGRPGGTGVVNFVPWLALTASSSVAPSINGRTRVLAGRR